MQDLVLFSGIQINTDQIGSYVMCLECTNKLKISATFRSTCLSNESHFHELCAVLAASAESTRQETVEYLESDDYLEDTTSMDKFDGGSLDYHSGKWSSESNQEILYEEEYIQEYLQDESTGVIEEHVDDNDFSYSANCVEPGEPLSDDDEWEDDNFGKAFYDTQNKRTHFVKRKGDIPLPGVLYGPAINPVALEDDWFEKDRPTGKRKQHLCDTCGLMTNHLKSHRVNHLKDFYEAYDEEEDVDEDIVEIHDEANIIDTNNQYPNALNESLEDYSANYINIGECSESDEADNEHLELSKNIVNKALQIPAESRSQSTISISSDEGRQAKKIETKRSRKSHRQYLCNLCGKLIHNFSFHLNAHANERKYACPHCPWKMSDKGHLAQHIRCVHLKLISKTCSICGKGFINNKTYASHLLSVHGIGEPCACTMCPRTFNQKSSLKQHMLRAHSNVIIPCDICEMAFKCRQSLKNHMRVHSTEQPYPCSKCPKRFKSSYSRKNHELTHSGIMFECDLCQKSYRYKS
uniref:C2H2-type domain-containing protein n=1 Tax=Anopheles culicifacies TaxID=139723 RepID=A0A182MP38_9DIPT